MLGFGVAAGGLRAARASLSGGGSSCCEVRQGRRADAVSLSAPSRAVVTMGHSRKKVKRHKKRMRKPAYQLEKSLLKMQHLFEEGDVFTAYAVWDYIRLRAHTPELDTYRGLLDGFDEIGTIGDVQSVLEEMERRGMATDDVSLMLALRAYGRRGLTEPMVTIYESLVNCGFRVPSEVFRDMMNCFVRQSPPDREGAEWVYKEMLRSKTRYDGAFWETKMELLQLRGDPDAVDYCFFDMYENYGYPPSENAAHVLLETFADAGWHVAMEDAFSEIKKFFLPYTERSYLPLIRAYIAAGRLDKAEQRYRDMQENGIQPGALSLEALFNAFLEAEDVDGMEQRMRDMAVYRIGPVVDMMDRLIHFYAERRDAAGVITTVKKKIMADLPLTADNHRDLWSCADLKLSGGEADDLEMLPVVELMQSLRGSYGEETDNFIFSLAFDGCLTLERFKEACRLLTVMEQEDIKPSLSLFNRVIHLLCEHGFVQDALAIFHLLRSEPYLISRQTIDPLIRCFAKQRNVEGVAAMYGHMITLDFMPRFRTRQWLYNEDWREPAVVAALCIDSPYRIRFYDPASVQEHATYLQQAPFIEKPVRLPRKGRANHMEMHGMDLDTIMDETEASNVFVGDAISLYRTLRMQLFRFQNFESQAGVVDPPVEGTSENASKVDAREPFSEKL